MADRDRFPKKVVLTVAQRAGYLCSNCRRPTSGPHSDPAKALIVGEAGHICAAGSGGARYDPNQTPEERNAITNAIWLCANCHKKLDTDWRPWPPESLQKTKAEHEQWIADEGMIPKLPDISLETKSGLQPHPNLPAITDKTLRQLRQVNLRINNDNRVPLFNLKVNLNLPEPVVAYGQLQKNAGTLFSCKPIARSWTVDSVSPSGQIEVDIQNKPCPCQLLEIAVLSPTELVSFSFYTHGAGFMMVCDQPGSKPHIAENPDEIAQKMPSNYIAFFLEGTYQFELRGEYITSDIFVPLRYVFKDRIVTSLACQSSRDSWLVQKSILFPGTIKIQG